MLGLAFPPGYARKQYFYVNYTDLRGNTVIARYRTTANPDIADAASETILMAIEQPYPNHNGGQVRFGPDGYLYIGMGDGGSAGDPQNRAQNPQTRLGKMLRVDVETDLSGVRIPPDNPFVNDSRYLPEIWALGLRNPWRFSFDRATKDLWIADVGQGRFEEVDFQTASSRGGENYGWNRTEGLECYPSGNNCNRDGITLPVIAYSHAEGCSVTGGFVYRGNRLPALRGMYLYGDYCSGKIWALSRENGRISNRLLLSTPYTISTFGEDAAGEIYVADHGRGEIYLFGAGAPAFQPGSVVNAASNAAGIVPGSLATVYLTGALDSDGIVAATGLPLPLDLNGVGITINGQRAPLLAVARSNGREQINFQAPFGLTGGAGAAMAIVRDQVVSTPVTVPLLSQQPGIFVNGAEAIIVHHNDNTLVTRDRPLAPGELAYFYATGLGAVENPPNAGEPAGANPLSRVLVPVQVTLGGTPCELLYAGLAPGFAGLYQINIRVPATTGDLDLVLTAGGAASAPARVPVR